MAKKYSKAISTVKGAEPGVMGRAARWAVVLACGLCVASARAGSDKTNTGLAVAEAREALAKWVEIRGVIAKERRDLVLAKEMLNDRIGVVARDIKAVQGKIGDAEKSIAEVDKKQQELAAENEKLEQASSALGASIVAMETRTVDLVKRLPEPIKDKVRMFAKQIPDDPNATKLSLSERFQNVIGTLTQIDKFNREITVTSERKKLESGESAEVTAVYVGLGQAYYASSNGRYAGTGTASPEGWVWTSANQEASRIAKVIAILKNEEVASFVQLPLEVK